MGYPNSIYRNTWTNSRSGITSRLLRPRCLTACARTLRDFLDEGVEVLLVMRIGRGLLGFEHDGYYTPRLHLTAITFMLSTEFMVKHKEILDIIFQMTYNCGC